MKIKLSKLTSRKRLLLETLLETFSHACNWYIQQLQILSTVNRGKLHKEAYHIAKGMFNLNTATLQYAGMKAISAQKSYLSRKRKKLPVSEPKFNGRTPVSFRQDIYKVVETDNKLRFVVKFPVSQGRSQIAIPLETSKRQEKLLSELASGGCRQGSAELKRSKNGVWYFCITLVFPKKEPIKVKGVLGVDLGVVKIATCSTIDGSINLFFGGKPIRWRRERLSGRRKHLMSKGRRYRVKKEKGHERRWMTDINHKISRQIVDIAFENNLAISLEFLRGIRDRTQLTKKVNRMISSWTFAQLISFIQYKAALLGVPVIFVDPTSTSRTCPKCGISNRYNRRKSDFRCKNCGYSLNADLVGARNIAFKGSMAMGYKPVADRRVAPGKEAVKVSSQTSASNPAMFS